MGGAYGIYVVEEKRMWWFGGETWMEETSLKT
jgi:hypothetical protein